MHELSQRGEYLNSSMSGGPAAESQLTRGLLQRIAERDQSAAGPFLEKYGNRIWAVSKKFTASSAEAETATRETFKLIWQCAARHDAKKCTEEQYVLIIAFRHLKQRSFIHAAR
jgi:DNA-directed RNA polymerase specialized sigma24 family protein